MDPDERARAVDWVREQMTAIDLKRPVTSGVWNLLNAWWALDHDTMSDEESKRVIDIFTSLAQNQALVESVPEESWVPARPGQIRMRAEVRVRVDAYPGDAGRAHNGRRGVVVGIRHGDIIVKYHDSNNVMGVHHMPQALDVRVS